MFPIEFMWTRSVSNLNEYIRYRIYVNTFPVQFMWTCCLVVYRIYVDTFPVEFMWTHSL